MNEMTQAAIEQLKSNGLRITQLRIDLIDFILSSTDHWTIQEMVDRVQKQMPKVGVATVYRTVNLLVDERFVTRTMLEDGTARFETTPEEHHDHMTCVICGKIVEFENQQIEKLQEKVAKELGFKLTDHRMELYGECLDPKRCKKRVKPKP